MNLHNVRKEKLKEYQPKLLVDIMKKFITDFHRDCGGSQAVKTMLALCGT